MPTPRRPLTSDANWPAIASPPEMRSRILGVLSVCIGSGPLGFVWLGLMAEALGAHWASVATGVAGLLSMAVTYRWWREI